MVSLIINFLHVTFKKSQQQHKRLLNQQAQEQEFKLKRTSTIKYLSDQHYAPMNNTIIMSATVIILYYIILYCLLNTGNNQISTRDK